MKANTIKKISVIALAAAMMTGMSMTAFADDTFDENIVGGAGSSVTFNNVFTVSEDDSAVNLPAAVFNYTIAPGTGAAATADSPLIRDGLAGATIGSAVHAATEADVTESTVGVTADFSQVNFEEAGIYRYSVTETEVVSNVSADIEIDVDNENLGTYIMDVYVKRDGEDFAPYAYILSKDGSIEDYTSGEGSAAVEYSNKIDTITNEYTTYDLTVSKEIIGDLAANSFAFTIGLANVPADVIFEQDGENYTGNSSYSLEADLADGQSTVIKGLPSTVSYKIEEAVNQLEGYKVEVADSNENAGEYNWIGEDGSAEAFGGSATIIGKADTRVDFTNTLNNISPTGLVLRFAPFALILGFGVILLVISRRRRNLEEEDER